jgi:hypothetical protein
MATGPAAAAGFAGCDFGQLARAGLLAIGRGYLSRDQLAEVLEASYLPPGRPAAGKRGDPK